MSQWHNARTPRQLVFAKPFRAGPTNIHTFILTLTQKYMHKYTYTCATIIVALSRIRAHTPAKVKYAHISPAKIVASSGPTVGPTAPDRCFGPRFIRVGSAQRGVLGAQRDRGNIMRIADSRAQPPGPSSSLTYARDESGVISWAAAAQHPWALTLLRMRKILRGISTYDMRILRYINTK